MALSQSHSMALDDAEAVPLAAVQGDGLRDAKQPGWLADAIPGDTSTTVVLTPNVGMIDLIDTPGDQDWFRVTLDAGREYTFTLGWVSPGFELTNPFLSFYDSSGVLIASDDDSGPGLDAEIASFTPTTTGVYFLAASGVGGATGYYRLFAIPQPDSIPSDTSTTEVLTVDGPSRSDTINFAGDRDYFKVEFVAGESYVITLNSSGADPLSDPYLEIVFQGAAFGAISVDDDGGPGVNSMMHFTAQTTGTYYLSAGGYIEAVGDYTIGVAHGPPQDPLDTLDLGFTFNTQNITIYFATNGQNLGPEGSSTAIRSWNAAEKAAVMSALGTIADVTNLTFTQVASAANADFVFTLADLQPGVLGRTWPDPSVAYLEFDVDGGVWTTSGLQPGGLAYSVIIHEVGHALGLDHPHLDGGDNQVMQGVTNIFDDYGDFLLNQQVFTIMSYNDGWPAGAWGNPSSFDYGYAQTPMALDIAALQARYGVDATRNSGNTTYTLPSNNTHPGYTAIWDTGGIDTIVYSGATSSVINLNAATLLSQVGGGGYVSYAFTIHGGLTIAAGVVIENATGSDAAADRIIGNSVANMLTGNGGQDTLLGGAGDDTLLGGAGDDTLDGEAGNDTMSGGAGVDTYLVDSAGDIISEFAGEGRDLVRATVSFTLGDALEDLVLEGANNVNGTGNALDNWIEGNSSNNTLIGAGGEDDIRGHDGDDILDGGDERDVLSGAAGNDLLLGGAGDDVVTADEGDDSLDGGAGADLMSGGVGNDIYFTDNANDWENEFFNQGIDTVVSVISRTLRDGLENLTLAGSENLDGAGNALSNTILGNGGSNTLFGYAGNDTLGGGAGADTLAGGLGNDTLSGGAGDDAITYVFGDGADTIDGGADFDTLGVTGSGADNLIQASWNGSVLTSVFSNTLSNLEAINVDMGAGVDTLLFTAASSVSVNLGAGAASGFASLIGVENVFGGAGGDTLVGGVGNNLLEGLGGADTLGGAGGNDIVRGGDGADLIVGGLGNDSLQGGAGADVFSWAWGDGVDTVNGGADGDTLNGAGSAGDNNLRAVWEGGVLTGALNCLLVGVETVHVAMGAGQDTILYTASAGVSVDLGAGAASGFASLTGVEHAIGGAGGDALTGDGGANQLHGIGGDDALNGAGGADILIGGDGADLIVGGLGNDSLQGGAGADVFSWAWGDGVDTFNGGADADTLNIAGSAAADILRAVWSGGVLTGAVNSALISIETVNAALGEGVDWLIYTAASGVTVDLAAGAASGFTALASVENVAGGTGDDSLAGDALNNRLDGGDGADALSGAGGADFLLGGNGDDALTGGAGNDSFIGGAGADVFVYAAGDGTDVISDFDADAAGGQDLIDITGFGVTSGDFAARVVINDIGPSTLLTIDGAVVITLQNVNGDGANVITVDDFILN